MTMIPYNTDLTRALKWLHNKAPNLQTIIQKKSDWYHRYNDQFWTNWQQNVFDIRTANAFGLVVWCIILGLPLDIFDFAPITNAFAFGAQRGNYLDGGGHDEPITFVNGPVIYNGGTLVPPADYSFNSTIDQVTFNTPPATGAVLTWTATVQGHTGQQLIINEPRQFGVGDGTTTAFSLIPSDSADFNAVGFNFYGGGSESVALLNEVRYACQLRYVALVSNGRQQWINQMLKYIFSPDAAWDFLNKKYFYLHDATGALQPVTGQSIWRSDWQGNVLLSSASRTNYLPYSNYISTSNNWTSVNSSTTSNSAGPDGTANGTCTVTPAAGFHGVSNGVRPSSLITGLALNTIYTFSTFIKSGPATFYTSTVTVYDSTYTQIIGQFIIQWSNGVPTLGGGVYIDGTAKVDSTGASGWYRIEFQFNTNSNASLGLQLNPDTLGGGNASIFAYPQLEKGTGAGSYISTGGAAASVTDYSLNTTTGAVTMAVAPANGAAMTWQGTWNWASWTAPSQFGTGDGSNVSFTLTEPPGAVKPITQAFYMEYRIGANLKLSAQFINILNNPSYGVMPQCGGVKYTVVQES